jgi:hypothetical protein
MNAKEIARARQQRTLRDHTYYQRMQELVDILERHLERFGHHAKDFFMRFRLRRLSGQIHDSQKSGNIGNLRPKSGQ